MAEGTVALINCVSCSKQISALANICPNCGNPNSWTHPAIKKFIETNDFEIEEFNFSNGRNWVKGSTADSAAQTSKKDTITVIMWLISMFTAFIPIICWMIYKYFSGLKNKNPREFQAEFNGNKMTWRSNDDNHWKPIKDFFEHQLLNIN